MNVTGAGRIAVGLPCDVRGRMTRSGGGGQGDVVSDEGGSWWVAARSRSTRKEPDCAVSLIRGNFR